MQLITMAHLGEAQSVIENFQLKRLSQNEFTSKDFDLLITGEGPFEAATKTALCLGKKNYEQIINLGIAGALSDKYQIGDVLEIRTSYLVINNNPQFHTFELSKDGIDCVSSFERVLNPKKAQELTTMGQIVDRELWGIAFAAKTAKVSLKSFKIISDMAGSLHACELVKENKEKFADLINEAFIKFVQKDSNKETHILDGFYFTFSMAHEFHDLVHKLSIKNDISKEEVLTLIMPHHFIKDHISKKDRAKNLLNSMKDLLNPTYKMIEGKINDWKKPLFDRNISLHTDPYLEDEIIKISFNIKNENELKEKIQALTHLKISPFHEILQGNFHVE